MPRVNGWEFLVEYAKLPEEQKAKVLEAMLTKSLNPDDAHKANEIKDIEAFLNKPLTADMIKHIVEEHFPV
jgi:CheY-like chemotaxis protein